MGTATATDTRKDLLRRTVRDFIEGVADATLLERLAMGGVQADEGRGILQALASDDLTVEARAAALALRKRDWLLDLMERHRSLPPDAAHIPREAGLSGDAFLQHYYSACRPAILTGEMSGWPALSRWSPEYLRKLIGSTVIEYQGERNKNALFEMQSNNHKRELPFDQYLEMVLRPDAANDAYITANNSTRNAVALAPLYADLETLDKFLTAEPRRAMPWIGPAGTFTALHHDLTNNFIAQVVGRKQVRLIPAADIGKLVNHHHVYSKVTDLESPQQLEQNPQFKPTRVYDLILQPGEILFVPIGWWHQVRSLDFSVTLTYINFRWRNDWYLSYPPG